MADVLLDLSKVYGGGVHTRLAMVTALLLAGLASSTAMAGHDDGARARALYEEAMKQYNLRRFEDALGAFQQAYLAKPDPVFLFDIGQCHRMLGHHDDAVYAYRRYLAQVPLATNRVEVEKLIISEEDAIRRKADATPPTGTLKPEEPAAVAPVSHPGLLQARPAPEEHPPIAHPREPAAAVATAPTAKSTRRWWIAGIAGGAAVVALVVLTVVLATSSFDSAPAGHLVEVRF